MGDNYEGAKANYDLAAEKVLGSDQLPISIWAQHTRLPANSLMRDDWNSAPCIRIVLPELSIPCDAV